MFVSKFYNMIGDDKQKEEFRIVYFSKNEMERAIADINSNLSPEIASQEIASQEIASQEIASPKIASLPPCFDGLKRYTERVGESGESGACYDDICMPYIEEGTPYFLVNVNSGDEVYKITYVPTN
jgi:hypothetical protein